VLDSLDLDDGPAHARLKDLLLDSAEDPEQSLQLLSNVLRSRLLEGHGETLFDLGQEDNGDSMSFTKDQWDIALERLTGAAGLLKAECRVLLTRHVGGPVEVGTVEEKDKSATGKIMIRQAPERAEDVIETRIAVIGNGIDAFAVTAPR
jgi:GTPase